VTFVEDAGDTLHKQRDALDSGYVFDVNADYSNTANQPVRWLAQGATMDAANRGFGKNDQDNEITGVHVSDAIRHQGILGREGARPVQGRLALVLHPAARRQRHLRGAPRAQRVHRSPASAARGTAVGDVDG